MKEDCEFDGEENVYSEEVRQEMINDGEISASEEAFMKGYDEASDSSEEPEGAEEEMF